MPILIGSPFAVVIPVVLTIVIIPILIIVLAITVILVITPIPIYVPIKLILSKVVVELPIVTVLFNPPNRRPRSIQKVVFALVDGMCTRMENRVVSPHVVVNF